MDAPRIEFWPPSLVPSPLTGEAHGAPWHYTAKQSPLTDFTRAVDLSAEFPSGFGKTLTSGLRDVAYPTLDQSPSALRLRRHWEGAAEHLSASGQKAAPGVTPLAAAAGSTSPSGLQQQLRDEAEAILSNFRQALSHSMSLHTSTTRLSRGGSSTAGSVSYGSVPRRFRDTVAAELLGLGALYASPGPDGEAGASDSDLADLQAEAAAAAAAVLARGPQRQLRWDDEESDEQPHSPHPEPVDLGGQRPDPDSAVAPAGDDTSGAPPQAQGDHLAGHVTGEGDTATPTDAPRRLSLVAPDALGATVPSPQRHVDGGVPASSGPHLQALTPQRHQLHGAAASAGLRLVDYSPSVITGHEGGQAADDTAAAHSPGTSSMDPSSGQSALAPRPHISWRQASAYHELDSTPTSGLFGGVLYGASSAAMAGSALSAASSPATSSTTSDHARQQPLLSFYGAQTPRPQSAAASSGGHDGEAFGSGPQPGSRSGSDSRWPFTSPAANASDAAVQPAPWAGAQQDSPAEQHAAGEQGGWSMEARGSGSGSGAPAKNTGPGPQGGAQGSPAGSGAAVRQGTDLSSLLDSPSHSTSFPTPSYVSRAYHRAAPGSTSVEDDGTEEGGFGPPRFGSGEEPTEDGFSSFSGLFAGAADGAAGGAGAEGAFGDAGVEGQDLGYFGASPARWGQARDAQGASGAPASAAGAGAGSAGGVEPGVAPGLHSSGAGDGATSGAEDLGCESPVVQRSSPVLVGSVATSSPDGGAGRDSPQSSSDASSHSESAVPTFSERPVRSRTRLPASHDAEAHDGEDSTLPFAYGVGLPEKPGLGLAGEVPGAAAHHGPLAPGSGGGRDAAMARRWSEGQAARPAGAAQPVPAPRRPWSHGGAGAGPDATPSSQTANDVSAAGGRSVPHVLSYEVSWASETERELAAELSRAWDAAGSVSRRHTRSTPGDLPAAQPAPLTGSTVSSGAPGSAFSFTRLSGPGVGSSGAGSAALSDLRSRMSAAGAALGTAAAPSVGSDNSFMTGPYDGYAYSSGHSAARSGSAGRGGARPGVGAGVADSARRRLDASLDALAEPQPRLAASVQAWQIQENPAFEEYPDHEHEATSPSTVGQDAPSGSHSSSPSATNSPSDAAPGGRAEGGGRDALYVLARELSPHASPLRPQLPHDPRGQLAPPPSTTASGASSKAPSGRATGTGASSSASDSPRTSALNRLMGSGTSPSLRQLQLQLGLLPRSRGRGGAGGARSEHSDDGDDDGDDDSRWNAAMTVGRPTGAAAGGGGGTVGPGPGTGPASAAGALLDPEVRSLVLELEHVQTQLARALAGAGAGVGGSETTPQSLPLLEGPAPPLPSAVGAGPLVPAATPAAAAALTPVGSGGAGTSGARAADAAGGELALGWPGSVTPVSGGIGVGSRAAQLAASAVSKALARVVKLSRENQGLQRLNEQLSGELSRAGTSQLELQARNKLLYAMLEERSRESEHQARSHQRRMLRLEAQLAALQQRSRQLERAHTQVSLEGQQAVRQLEASRAEAAEAAAAAEALRAQVAALEGQLQGAAEASGREAARRSEAGEVAAREAQGKARQLKASAAESAAQAQRLQERLQAAERRLAHQTADAEAARAAAAAEAARAEQLASQLRAAQGAADELSARLRDAEEAAFAHEERLEAARIAMAELAAERAAARADVMRGEDEARSALAEARRLAEAAAARAAAAEAAAAELQQRLEVAAAEAEVAAAEMRQQLEAAAWEAERRGGEAAEAAQRAAEAEAREAGLHEELRAAAAERERTWRELEDAQRAHTRLQEELLRNDRVAMELLQQAEEAGRGASEQAARAEQLQRRLDAQAVAAAAAAEAHAAALAGLRVEQARLRADRESAAQQLAALAAELQAANRQLEARERERSELAAARTALADSAARDAAALAEAREELRCLRDQVAEAEARALGEERDDEDARRQLQGELERTQELLAGALQAQARAEGSAAAAGAALAEAQRAGAQSEEALRRRLAEAHEAKRSLEQERASQAAADEYARLDVARLQEQLVDVREARARLQDELDNVAAELSSVRAASVELEAELRSELHAARAALERAAEEHLRALSEVRERAERAEAHRAAAEEEAEQARAVAERAARRADEVEARCTAAEKEAEQARAWAEAEARRADEAEVRCAAVEEEAEQARTRADEAAQRADEAEARRAAAEAEAAEARAWAEGQARRAEEAEARRAAAEAEAAHARAAAGSEARRAGELDAEMVVATRRLVELQMRLEAAQAELAAATATQAGAVAAGMVASPEGTPDAAVSRRSDSHGVEWTPPSGAAATAARRLDLTAEADDVAAAAAMMQGRTMMQDGAVIQGGAVVQDGAVIQGGAVAQDGAAVDHERLLLRSAAEVAAATPGSSPTAVAASSASSGGVGHSKGVGADAGTPSGPRRPERRQPRSEGSGAPSPSSSSQSPSLQLAGEVVSARAELADLRRRHADAEELIALMGQQLSESRAREGELQRRLADREDDAAAAAARAGALQRELEARAMELVDARSAAELAALRLPGTAWGQPRRQQTHGSAHGGTGSGGGGGGASAAAAEAAAAAAAPFSPLATHRTGAVGGGLGGLGFETPYSLWAEPGSVAPTAAGHPRSPLGGGAAPTPLSPAAYGPAYLYAPSGSPRVTASHLRSSAALSPEASSAQRHVYAHAHAYHPHAHGSPLRGSPSASPSRQRHRGFASPARRGRPFSPAGSGSPRGTGRAVAAAAAAPAATVTPGGRVRASSGGSGSVQLTVQLLELRFAVQRVEEVAGELATVLLAQGSASKPHPANSRGDAGAAVSLGGRCGGGGGGLGLDPAGVGVGVGVDAASEAALQERAWLADSLAALTRRAGALAAQLADCLEAALLAQRGGAAERHDQQQQQQQQVSPSSPSPSPGGSRGLTPLAVRRLESELAGLQAQFSEAQRQAEAALETQAEQHAAELSSLSSDAAAYRCLVERLRVQLGEAAEALRAERAERAEREEEERLHAQSLQRVCQQLATKSARQEDTIARLRAQLDARGAHDSPHHHQGDDDPDCHGGSMGKHTCRQYRVSSPPSDQLTHGSLSSAGASAAHPLHHHRHEANGGSSSQGSCGSRTSGAPGSGRAAGRAWADGEHAATVEGAAGAAADNHHHHHHRHGCGPAGTEAAAPGSPSPSEQTVGEPCSSQSASSTPGGAAPPPATGPRGCSGDGDGDGARGGAQPGSNAVAVGRPDGRQPSRYGGRSAGVPGEGARAGDDGGGSRSGGGNNDGGGGGGGGSGGGGVSSSEVEERLWRELAQLLAAAGGGGSRGGGGGGRGSRDSSTTTSANDTAATEGTSLALALVPAAEPASALVALPGPSSSQSHSAAAPACGAVVSSGAGTSGSHPGLPLSVSPAAVGSAGGRAALLARAVSHVAVMEQQNRKLVKLLARLCGRGGASASCSAGAGGGGGGGGAAAAAQGGGGGGGDLGEAGSLALAAALESLRRENRALAAKYAAAQVAHHQSSLALHRLGRENRELHDQLHRQVRARIQDLSDSLRTATAAETETEVEGGGRARGAYI